jgi:hypothetical protein
MKIKKILKYTNISLAYLILRLREQYFQPKQLTAGKIHVDLDEECLEIDNYPRIALVKQDVYSDLYCCPNGLSSRDTILSTHMRTGPVALFTKFNTEFWIVKTESDKECNIWKQQALECHLGTVSQLEAMKTDVYKNGARGHKYPQGKFSVSVSDIDWSKYDIVISLNVSVPKRITQQFRKTLWCYCIGEPGMSAYMRSHKKPIDGYDVFLNQRFRVLKDEKEIKDHEIDFPYYLHYYGCFNELYNLPLNNKRSGIMLEHHMNETLTESVRKKLEQFPPLRSTELSTFETTKNLLSSKYFLHLGGNRQWGNAMIEAVACGALAISDPELYKNRGLFTDDVIVKNIDEAVDKMIYFDSNPNAYSLALEEQRHRLDYICYYKPIKQVVKKWREKIL